MVPRQTEISEDATVFETTRKLTENAGIEVDAIDILRSMMMNVNLEVVEVLPDSSKANRESDRMETDLSKGVWKYAGNTLKGVTVLSPEPKTFIHKST